MKHVVSLELLNGREIDLVDDGEALSLLTYSVLLRLANLGGGFIERIECKNVIGQTLAKWSNN